VSAGDGWVPPSLLGLSPDETAAKDRLHQFAADHPGVTVITPHHHDEPWRADIAEGAIPGEGPRTSKVIGAEWPSGLLGKLTALFAPP
jgi:hypothetical protein